MNSVMKKIHRTNLLSKIISFMLAFVMMGCMLVPVGYADSPDEYVTDDEEEIVIVPFELPLLPGDLTPEEAKDAVGYDHCPRVHQCGECGGAEAYQTPL